MKTGTLIWRQLAERVTRLSLLPAPLTPHRARPSTWTSPWTCRPCAAPRSSGGAPRSRTSRWGSARRWRRLRRATGPRWSFRNAQKHLPIFTRHHHDYLFPSMPLSIHWNSPVRHLSGLPRWHLASRSGLLLDSAGSGFGGPGSTHGQTLWSLMRRRQPWMPRLRSY